MWDRIRRGRRVVLIYVALHIVLMAVSAAAGFGGRRRAERAILRLITQATLLHSLWRGNRWARGLHILGLSAATVVLGWLCVRTRDTALQAVFGGIAAVCSFYVWQLSFSSDVRAFFAYQRGALRPEELSGARGAANAVFLEDSIDENDGGRPTVPCGCGARMPAFVVCCPGCGARRD